MSEKLMALRLERDFDDEETGEDEPTISGSHTTADSEDTWSRRTSLGRGKSLIVFIDGMSGVLAGVERATESVETLRSAMHLW